MVVGNGEDLFLTINVTNSQMFVLWKVDLSERTFETLLWLFDKCAYPSSNLIISTVLHLNGVLSWRTTYYSPLHFNPLAYVSFLRYYLIYNFLLHQVTLLQSVALRNSRFMFVTLILVLIYNGTCVNKCSYV